MYVNFTVKFYFAGILYFLCKINFYLYASKEVNKHFLS
jgi:hypothetical protein